MPIYKGKKVNRFNFDKNRKTAAKRTKTKIKKREQLKAGSAEEKVLGKVWDNRRSFKQNFASIGLSVDPNKAVKIGKTRIMTEGEEVQKTSKRQEKVIKELETVAANARVKDWTVSQDDIHFCVTMLDKHEQNWKAMAKDRTNYYQLTPAQIRTKMKHFRRDTVSWNCYMKDRKERGLEEIELEI